MQRRGQRSHFGLRIQRIAQADRARQGDEALEETLGDALMEDQPRTGDAGLALVVEDRPGGAVERRIQVGVVEHDVRALAA